MLSHVLIQHSMVGGVTINEMLRNMHRNETSPTLSPHIQDSIHESLPYRAQASLRGSPFRLPASIIRPTKLTFIRIIRNHPSKTIRVGHCISHDGAIEDAANADTLPGPLRRDTRSVHLSVAVTNKVTFHVGNVIQRRWCGVIVAVVEPFVDEAVFAWSERYGGSPNCIRQAFDGELCDVVDVWLCEIGRA
ncbi:hypothetical protein P280DRAFT_142011 [Massarina eburnea CBS 473.64]|uniref:Uncharacterized protein n=1 Tax=Massarina eburnea CBS 473.64 TaxID=1395130 RepID=A0A6A6RNV1_9PLEO|nr:hypothetical protein P280DRAFT_142011 [Massarina eburnea CBS 473.64]